MISYVFIYTHSSINNYITSLASCLCSDVLVGLVDDEKTELAVLVAASLGLNDTTGELF